MNVGGTMCLSRGVNEGETAQCNTNFVNTCNAQNNYSDMESCSEMGYVGHLLSSPHRPTCMLTALPQTSRFRA